MLITRFGPERQRGRPFGQIPPQRHGPGRPSRIAENPARGRYDRFGERDARVAHCTVIQWWRGAG